MWFDRRRKAADRAEALDRALAADDLSAFDPETQELVATARALRPGVSQSEAAWQATYDRIMHGPRVPTPRRPSEVPEGTQLTAASTVRMQDGDAQYRLSDIEDIDAKRADEVAARVRNVLARLDGE